MLAVLKKELKTYFLTPIGYIFIGLFLAVYSVMFYLYIFNYGNLNFSYVFYDTAFLLTFVVGILTMNMFAGERKSGTDQLIMTSPKSTAGIVFGKIFAAMIVILITELFSLVYLGIISYFGTPDLSTLLTTLIGFILLTITYISFGAFVSSLTTQPFIAYIITFAALFASMYITNISESFSMFYFLNLFSKFTEGLIPVLETVQLVSFSALCIILTMINLQRRKNIK